MAKFHLWCSQSEAYFVPYFAMRVSYNLFLQLPDIIIFMKIELKTLVIQISFKYNVWYRVNCFGPFTFGGMEPMV